MISSLAEWLDSIYGEINSPARGRMVIPGIEIVLLFGWMVFFNFR